jgi:hypothetical protein
MSPETVTGWRRAASREIQRRVHRASHRRDLMNLADPDDIGGDGTGVFTFPFVTIESVIPLGRRTLGVLNDNNYPFGSGRTPSTPDDNEFIVIRLDAPLPMDGHGRDERDDDDWRGDSRR